MSGLYFTVCEECGAMHFPLYATRPAKKCHCGGDVVGTAEAQRRQYPRIASEQVQQLTPKELPNG